MLAFTDSIEAAQNRVTDAVDQWALWADGAEVMKDFYNILAYVIRNLDTFGITIGGLLLALNAKSVLNTVAGGIGKAGSATIGFTNKVDNFMSNLSTKGVGTTMADTIYGALETSYLESVQEKYTNQLIKATQGLQKEEQTRAVNLSKMLMEGDERDTLLANMISQNEVTAQNTHLSSKYGLRLIAADGTMTELLTVEERQKLANMLLNTNIDEKTKEVIKSITTSKNLQLSQEQLNAMSDALAQAYKNEIIELSTGTASGYRDETGNGNWKTGLKAGLATGAGSIIAGVSGSILGSNLGSAFGEDGQIAGTMIGGVLAETAVPVFAKAMGKGLLATAAEGGVLSGAFSKIGGLLAGPFGAALLMGIPAIISVVLDLINAQTKQAIEDAANYFQEQSDKYSSMTSVLNDVTTFDKYAEGVDRLGKNVSLTDDEYQKWLDSSNALAEVFPDLIQYTDSLLYANLGAPFHKKEDIAKDNGNFMINRYWVAQSEEQSILTTSTVTTYDSNIGPLLMYSITMINADDGSNDFRVARWGDSMSQVIDKEGRRNEWDGQDLNQYVYSFSSSIANKLCDVLYFFTANDKLIRSKYYFTDISVNNCISDYKELVSLLEKHIAN